MIIFEPEGEFDSPGTTFVVGLTHGDTFLGCAKYLSTVLLLQCISSLRKCAKPRTFDQVGDACSLSEYLKQNCFGETPQIAFHFGKPDLARSHLVDEMLKRRRLF